MVQIKNKFKESKSNEVDVHLDVKQTGYGLQVNHGHLSSQWLS